MSPALWGFLAEKAAELYGEGWRLRGSLLTHETNGAVEVINNQRGRLEICKECVEIGAMLCAIEHYEACEKDE